MSTTSANRLPRDEWIARIRLIRTENVGPISFRQLLRRFGSAVRALEALPDLARKGGRTRRLIPYPEARVEQELVTHDRFGSRLVVLGEDDYPPILAATEDGPPVISVLGHTHLAARSCVAIVGARNGSANARGLTQRLAADLGEAGFVVVSGLARGIDAAAHRGALPTGTVAVVAGGVDVTYPPENEALQGEIGESGLIIAESPIGTVPQARHFPSRNRIIAGLSLGTVVVEATARSGSLITARFAAEYGREVMAVPGSPLDPRTQGPNALIRDGARLVTSADDVIDTLREIVVREDPPEDDVSFAAPALAVDQSEVDRARAVVLELLGPEPVAVDEIIRGCQFSPTVVLTVLLEAELAGVAERHPGNRVARRFDA